MKVSIIQENLSKALSVVIRAVASRSTLPVLSNVLLATAGPDRLKLSATNLEIGINYFIGCKVEAEGAITVPARLLAELVNSLAERIDLTLDETTQTLNIKCGRYESNIKGISAEEFPLVPDAPESGGIRLSSEVLRPIIERVIIAAATDESRPILTGVLVQFNSGKMTMAAADGFRLSVNCQNSLPDIEATEAIIPASALSEVARALKECNEVGIHISPSRKQIIFDAGEAVIVSQLIEGRFPDYNQIVPKSHTTRSILDTAAFLKAVKVCQLFARDSANIIKLVITPSDDPSLSGRVVLTAISAESGDNVAEVDASVEGEGMEVAFNARYLIDVLAVIDSPQVTLETTLATNPGVIRPVGDDGFSYMLMPMSIG